MNKEKQAEELKKILGLERLGSVSDGYHTFDELYHHRAVLFSVICNQNKNIAWKSKKHDDGTMFKDMFIVGINTPAGQATYHYDVEPYWNMFKVKKLKNAPKWDGHTPEQAIERINKINTDMVFVDKDYFKELEKCKLKLEILECYGVDNWEGYDLAIQEYYNETGEED